MALKSGRVGIHPSQVDPITGMLIAGPGGTTDYTQLTNKPQINNVTLTGNKSLSDLGIATSFDTLTDSAINNPEVGQTLIYNGTGWENEFSSISPTTLSALQDVQITDPEVGQTLIYNGEGWENEFSSISSTTLSALQDVQITDPKDGEYLTYDSVNSKWINSGEAPVPEFTDITVTLYGAVEDTISFTDAAGISHSEVFASGQSSKSVTFKINPTGSTSITFTSGVAKNPDDLTADYSKSVTITSATTEIKVMPDNALYWYGKKLNLQNPGKSTSAYTKQASDESTNYISVSGQASNVVKSISGNNLDINKITVAKCIVNPSTVYGTRSSLTLADDNNVDDHTAVSNTGLQLLTVQKTKTFTNPVYIAFEAVISNRVANDVYALWYE